MANGVPYYASNDDYFTAFPLINKHSQVPTTFVGIGSPGCLHALSFLSDHVPVKECHFVDLYGPQIDFLKRAVDLIIANPDSHWDYLDAFCGVKFNREKVPQWEDVDVSKVGEAWGFSGVHKAIITNQRRLQVPGPTKSTAAQGTNGIVLEQLPGRNSIGFNFGYLLDGAYPPPLNNVSYHVSTLSDFLRGPFQQIRQKSKQIVVWCSNALTYYFKWKYDPTLKPHFIRRFDNDPNTFFWLSGESYKSGPGRQILVKNVGPGRGKSPHWYTNVAIGQLRRSGPMIVVHAFPAGADRPDEFPKSRKLGWRTFLNGSHQAATIVLHMVSCGEHGKKLSLSLLGDCARHALSNCKKLLVMEHNCHTLDRNNLHNDGVTIMDVREAAGRREDRIRWCYGRNHFRRNMIAVYNM